MNRLISKLMTPATERSEIPNPRLRTRRSDALHVFVMTSFAIAQPVFDRLGNRLSFLTDQNIPNMAVWILVLTLSIGLPVTVILLELLAEWISRRSRDVVHSAVVFIVSALMTALGKSNPSALDKAIAAARWLKACQFITIL